MPTLGSLQRLDLGLNAAEVRGERLHLALRRSERLLLHLQAGLELQLGGGERVDVALKLSGPVGGCSKLPRLFPRSQRRR